MKSYNTTLKLGASYLLKLVDGTSVVATYQMSPSGCIPLFRLSNGAWVSPLYVEILDGPEE